MNGQHPTVIEFIRHGLPEGGNRYRGNGIDDPLCDTGWQQMRDAMADDSAWDQVISSPMRRCREFAEEFCASHGIGCVVEQDLIEVGFGSWEGKTKQQLRQEDEVFFERFYQDSVANRPPGAESLVHLQQRVVGVFESLRDRYEGQRILVVAHAGVMRIVLMHVLDIPLARMYRINIDYAMRLRFEIAEHVRVMLR